MQYKQESLKTIFSEQVWARKREIHDYAINLLSHDLSHIQLQADMRGANSAELSLLLDEVSDVLARYQ